MPNFKPKADKIVLADTNSMITIDNKHQELIDEFRRNKETIERLKSERVDIKNKIRRKDYVSIDEAFTLKELLDEKKNEIQRLLEKEKEYKLTNSENVFSYFEKRQDIENDNTETKKVVLKNFFSKNSSKRLEPDSTETTSDTKKYLQTLSDDFINIDDMTIDHTRCPKCEDGEMVNVDYEGLSVCNKCAYQVPFLVEHEKPSFKEPPKEVSFYAYKRINHWREIIAQVQAKESTTIDDKIIDRVKKQIKKERITLDKLTNEKTKEILKRLQLNNYYEHIPFIKDKLGIPPPVMSVELETILCNLFMEIQKPYSKFCPNERQNFLNYYFVLYKLCELLGEDDYLDNFYMLKDPIKRMEQDEIWKKICDELNWEFIPTP